MAAVDGGEILRREGIEHAQQGCPPAVPGQVPGQQHGAHEGHPDGQDKLEAYSSGRVCKELHPNQGMVDIGEKGVDGRNAAQAGIVPFRDDGIFGTEDSAADAVQLVAVQHQGVRIEGEFPKDNEKNAQKHCGGDRKKQGFLV